MKIKDSVFFPHPVLRENNNDYRSSKFETNLSHKNLVNEYLIKLTLNLDNKELLELIEKNKAKIICHMECSKTKFRDIQKLNLGENEFMIHAGDVDYIVFILPLIIANENIDNYYSKDFNKDYGNDLFKIKKGDILAIGKHFPIIIENERGKLSNIPSIFLINASTDKYNRSISVSLLNNKIEIYVPESVYKIYNKYRKNKFYNDIMCSVIILPSLVYVLDKLKEEDGIFIEYGEKRWFRVINKKLKEKGIDFEKKELNEKDTFKLAQDILEYLSSRTIDSLKELEKVEENGE